MEITKNLNGSELTILVSGRLDTTTAPTLETEIQASLDNVTSLFIDFSSLEYISSAGLRVILMAQKIMNTKGTMVIKGANDDIKEIFEITGFSDILTVE